MVDIPPTLTSQPAKNFPLLTKEPHQKSQPTPPHFTLRTLLSTISLLGQFQKKKELTSHHNYYPHPHPDSSHQSHPNPSGQPHTSL